MSDLPLRVWAVIPAAGRGDRFGTGRPKQYAELRGRALIEWSLAPFLARADIAGIVIALVADDPDWPCFRPADSRVSEAPGGADRAASVGNALDALAERGVGDSDWVLVHDAARPCLDPTDLDKLLERGRNSPDGALLAAPLDDTLKRAVGGCVVDTVDRRDLWRAMTPQLFRLGPLRQALQAAAASGIAITDEASAIEQQGGRPLLVQGRTDNIKVTRMADLALADAVLAAREH